jgi:hypothetical protein
MASNFERRTPSRPPLSGKAVEGLEVETGTITMIKGHDSYVMAIQPPMTINDNARFERMRIQPVSRAATKAADILKFDPARFGQLADHRDINFELYSNEVRELLGTYALESVMRVLPTPLLVEPAKNE